MKKKIPELLDFDDEIVVTDEIRNLFDPEEIKEMTMNKIHQNEPQASRVRKPAMVILAAAAAAALTMTAFAAYQFLIADQFGGYFGELTNDQAEVMEQIGTGEMPACTANGTTLTPLTAIGDESQCYMKFRLEAPEGTEWPETEEEWKALHIFAPTAEDWYSIADENGEDIPVYSEIEWIDAAPGDQTVEFIVRFSSDMDSPAHFNDGKSKILTIPGIWREEPDKEYTKLLEGPWSFDIGFYGAAAEVSLDVDGLPVTCTVDGVEQEEEGVSITLRAMRISPLALTYTCDFTSPDPNMVPGPGDIQIVMKDGSTVETLGGQGSFSDSYFAEQSIIQAPVDLEKVDYIQFGNQQIKMG